MEFLIRFYAPSFIFGGKKFVGPKLFGISYKPKAQLCLIDPRQQYSGNLYMLYRAQSWKHIKKRLVSRNLETQEVNDLGITGSRYSFVDPYVESLVLLGKSDLAVTY